MLPFLAPGMSLLDCGCGPGTITIGFAGRVAPGLVTGVDLDESQLALAQENARTQGIVNIAFRHGSAYELPFGDGEFDAVFCHALLEHLREPARAVAEFIRVLRPAGVLGVCAPDWGGYLHFPPSDALAEAMRAYLGYQSGNGGDIYVGRKLAGFLQDGGFDEVKPRAYYEHMEPPAELAEVIAFNLDRNGDGLHAAMFRQWAMQPGAVFEEAWVYCTGRKPVG